MLDNNIINEFNKITLKFGEEGIDYCLLRNFFETDSSHFSATDFDILISKRSYPKSQDILKKLGFIIKFGGPIPGHQVYIKYYSALNKFITLDIQVGGLSSDGILYFPEDILLNGKVLKKHLFIPSIETYIAALVLHSIVDKKYFKDNYKEEVDKFLLTSDKEELLIEIVHSLLSVNLADTLTSLLLKRDYDNLLRLRCQILVDRAFSYPHGLISFLIIYLTRVKKVLNPLYLGAMVAFIGPDGAGKSSAIDSTQEILRSGSFRSKKVYMGWRGSVLPFISSAMRVDQKIFKEKNKSDTITRRSLVTKTRSIFISLLYFVELFLRYMFIIFPYRKLGYVILTDRYFYDRIALDHLLPKFLKKLYSLVIPKPDVCIYLFAPEDVLIKRENKLSLNNLKSQLEGFEENKHYYNPISINTFTKNKQQTAKDIIRSLQLKLI